MDRVAENLAAMVPALLFLCAGVPLAALLDRLGLFDALAVEIERRRERIPVLALWVLAAATTAVLNLDTTVVLLTPLYARLARRGGCDPFAVTAIPLLLASLASSFLPVSNLTTLIAVERLDLTVLDVVGHLALPSLAACTVAWLCYRRRHPTTISSGDPGEPDRRALLVGGAVVGGLLVGFVLGPSWGVDPWVVALVADAVLVAVLRWVPWREVPLITAIGVAALGAVVTVAVPADLLRGPLHTDSPAAVAGLTALAAIAANAVNNLPALLIALDGVDQATWGMWAWLLGINVGAALLPLGALANILWWRIARSEGIAFSLRTYARITFPVVIPALVAAAVVLAAMPRWPPDAGPRVPLPRAGLPQADGWSVVHEAGRAQLLGPDEVAALAREGQRAAVERAAQVLVAGAVPARLERAVVDRPERRHHPRLAARLHPPVDQDHRPVGSINRQCPSTRFGPVEVPVGVGVVDRDNRARFGPGPVGATLAGVGHAGELRPDPAVPLGRGPSTARLSGMRTETPSSSPTARASSMKWLVRSGSSVRRWVAVQGRSWNGTSHAAWSSCAAVLVREAHQVRELVDVAAEHDHADDQAQVRVAEPVDVVEAPQQLLPRRAQPDVLVGLLSPPSTETVRLLKVSPMRRPSRSTAYGPRYARPPRATPRGPRSRATEHRRWLRGADEGRRRKGARGSRRGTSRRALRSPSNSTAPMARPRPAQRR